MNHVIKLLVVNPKYFSCFMITTLIWHKWHVKNMIVVIFTFWHNRTIFKSCILIQSVVFRPWWFKFCYFEIFVVHLFHCVYQKTVMLLPCKVVFLVWKYEVIDLVDRKLLKYDRLDLLEVCDAWSRFLNLLFSSCRLESFSLSISKFNFRSFFNLSFNDSSALD